MDIIGKIFNDNENRKIKIIGGDLTEGEWEYKDGILWGPFEHIEFSDQVTKVSLQTEESIKKLSHSLGWGLAGLVAAGPLGAVAGAVLGGNRKQVCALLELKDNRRILALMDQKLFQHLMALSLKNS